MLPTIRRWVVVISGFTQNESENHGCQQLWLKLHAELAGPDTAVLLVPWNHSMQHLAQRIAVCSTPDRLLTVFPYSWGAGKAFLELAALTQIDSAVLCDPISFPIIGFPLFIPAGVSRCWAFIQKQSIPSSAGLVAGSNVLGVAELSGHTHETIDEAPEWHDLCMRVATGAIDAE